MTELLSKNFRKPSRLPRVDREDPVEGIGEDGHSWAVSYADFLMVLLSFFVIFFSLEGDKKEEIYNRLIAGSPAAEGKAPTNYNDKLPSGVNSVLSKVEGLYVSRPDEKQKLYIYFEDNIYAPGQLDLNEDQVTKLKGILTQLEPFMKEINVTFIGHTDSSTVSASRNRYIDNNFDLSSLRATKALQQAVRAGFNPDKMFAKGVAEHSRGSRTLSLVISPSGEE
ncbi:MAG: flagellar motor protein MotB [Bdellovibrionales bacterium]